MRDKGHYAHDNVTAKQESLKTSDRTEALRLLNAKNEAEYQPAFNGQLARTHLATGDSALGKRTWQLVMDTMLQTKEGGVPVAERATNARHQAEEFQHLRSLPLLQTRPEHLLGAIERGTVSTNIFLRRLHSFALKMGWLPWPILGLLATLLFWAKNARFHWQHNPSVPRYYSRVRIWCPFCRPLSKRRSVGEHPIGSMEGVLFAVKPTDPPLVR